MMRRLVMATLLFGLALPMPDGSGAQAATITRIYDFSFSGFSPGGVSPVDPWTGTIKVTFDPAVDVPGPATPDYFSSNLPAPYGAFVFAYTAAVERFSVCNNWAGACAAGAGFDQASFRFSAQDPDNPAFINAFVGSVSNPSALAATATGSVTLHTGPDPSLVPEPASLVLLSVALMGLGWARTKRT